jgi:gluconolactonase
MERRTISILSVAAALAAGFAVVSARTQTRPSPSVGGAGAQTSTDSPFKIVKLDPRLDSIVSPDAKLESLGDRFGLTEGPVWIQQGNNGHLLFTDMLDNVIYKWAPNSPISVFLENSGYTGKDVLNVGQQTRRGRSAVILIGSNGLTLDPQGRLVICAMSDRTIIRLEKDGTTRTVLSERFEGKRFNGPNDVIVKKDGAIYFTDSASGLRGGMNSPQKELPFNGFYLVKDGQVTLLDETLKDPQAQGFPNGIALSPDEKHLYVTLGRKIVRYEVRPDDTVTNRQEFADVMGNDGMKVDQKGNLYSTSGAGPGEVRITSPEGKRLGLLQMPQKAGEPRSQICTTNLAFGDADSKALYITACMSVYKIRLNTPGVRPGPQS